MFRTDRTLSATSKSVRLSVSWREPLGAGHTRQRSDDGNLVIWLCAHLGHEGKPGCGVEWGVAGEKKKSGHG